MKLVNFLNSILKESVGVPNNITKVSQEIFNLILVNLEGIIEYDEKALDYNDVNFDIISSFKVSDMVINEIQVELNVILYNNVQLAGMYVSKRPSILLPHVKFESDGNLKMGIKITATPTTNGNEIIELLKNNRSEFVSSISHEIMHEYDFYKKPKSRLEKQIEYTSSQQNVGDIPTISEFLYGLYYLHDFENSVRPVEFYTNLVENGITKQTFLKNLNNNKVIQNITPFRNMTYDSFFEKLEDSYSLIYNLLKSNDFDVRGFSKREIVDFLLFLLRKMMIGWRISTAKQVIPQDPMDMFASMFGVETKSEKFFNNFLKKLTLNGKFIENEFDEDESPKINKIFFTKRIKELNNSSNLLYRKLVKVYSLLPDENENILHKKISSKK